MATLLSITNKVLRRLREDEVVDLVDSYPALVASFVADIHQEVSEAAMWAALDNTVGVDVIADTRTYDLSAVVANGGAVASGNAVNEKSLLLYDQQNLPQAWIFDDDSDRYGIQMYQIDRTDRQSLFYRDTGMTQDKPIYFSLAPTTDMDGYTITLWPTPSATNYIRLNFNTPEAELDPSTDANVTIVIPERPIYLGALYMALNERGEEIGEPGGIAEMRYHQALAAAIETNIRHRERTGYYDWFRN